MADTHAFPLRRIPTSWIVGILDAHATSTKHRPSTRTIRQVLTNLAITYRTRAGLAYTDETVTQIAQACDISPETVSTALTILDRAGWIRTIRRGGPGRGTRRSIPILAYLHAMKGSELTEEYPREFETVLTEIAAGTDGGIERTHGGIERTHGGSPRTPEVTQIDTHNALQNETRAASVAVDIHTLNAMSEAYEGISTPSGARGVRPSRMDFNAAATRLLEQYPRAGWHNPSDYATAALCALHRASKSAPGWVASPSLWNRLGDGTPASESPFTDEQPF